MGEFNAGSWLVGISIYFFFIFVILYSYLGAATYYDIDATGSYVNDPGFTQLGNNNTLDTTVAGADTIDWGNIYQTFAFMFGFSYAISLPGAYYFMFVFIFIWIPTIMFFYALYMVLPFIH